LVWTKALKPPKIAQENKPQLIKFQTLGIGNQKVQLLQSKTKGNVGPAGLFPQPDHWKVLTLDPPQL
jgi:hypothetical protein